jgi:small subunit ribosomal protein S20
MLGGEILANIKKKKKRVLIAKARNERNKGRRSELKTRLKKARAEDASAGEIKLASVTVARAASKGIIHKNKAARLKSQLAKKQNASA